MKQLFKTTIAIMLLAFAITSCNKDGDPITPPGPGAGDHPVLWSYDLGFGGMADVIPAIDNNNNVYFSMVSEDYTEVIAIGLDSDGNELWKNVLDGTITGKVMYTDGKVIVTTGYPTAIYCLNASSGNTEWSKNLTEEYDFQDNPSMAFANNKIYLLSYQFLYGFIVTYDLSGTELVVQEAKQGFNLSMYDNALFYHDLDSLYSYEDTGAGFSFSWKWAFPEMKNSRSLLTLYDIPVGDDGSIYIRDDAAIYIVSQSGQLTKTINLDASYYEGFVSNVAITNNGDMILGKGDLVKISNDGSTEWVTDINDGMIINPSFLSAPVISASGDMYDGQLFGLYSIKSNGTLNWRENAETGAGTEYGNLHPPVLTHDGNIIIVSSEQSVVRCFKGDGQGLATGGWPKPFGDYGNTSSK
ncbi:MAG: PQQ-like beta-propeller repeat protein [Bacteroidetes bacterium]|nr:PQQ-like beta-propeller repeat protein [Bacteroidota bacterium]